MAFGIDRHPCILHYSYHLGLPHGRASRIKPILLNGTDPGDGGLNVFAWLVTDTCFAPACRFELLSSLAMFEPVAQQDMAASSCGQESGTATRQPARYYNKLLWFPNECEDGWDYNSFDCYRGEYNMAFRANYKTTYGDHHWSGSWIWSPRYEGLKLESFQTWSGRDGFPVISLYYRIQGDDVQDELAEHLEGLKMENASCPVLPRPFMADMPTQPAKRPRFVEGA